MANSASPQNFARSLLAIAWREQRILLVADRDFGELIFHQGLAHTGIIFFRLPGAPLQTKIEQLDAVLERHADAGATHETLSWFA
jgi:hypothetical protein